MTDTISRRDLLVGLKESVSRRAIEKVASARPLRPPHAIDEVDFLLTCDGCQKCVDACPHGSIYILQTDDVADGTPVLSPADRPCHLCEDLPCVVACTLDALRLDRPLRVFGYVTISEEHCITFRGPECGACNVCPGDVRAIRFARNRPVVDVEQCVGCGLCIDACPTNPVAIEFHKADE